MVGSWTPCLALPSELSLAASQGLAPAHCFGSLGYLEMHVVSVVSECFADESILLCFLWLFCDGTLFEVLLFHFGSIQASPAYKAIWKQNCSGPAAQVLWRSKDWAGWCHKSLEMAAPLSALSSSWEAPWPASSVVHSISELTQQPRKTLWSFQYDLE